MADSPELPEDLLPAEAALTDEDEASTAASPVASTPPSPLPVGEPSAGAPDAACDFDLSLDPARGVVLPPMLAALADECFVSFFNAFLALPAFPQRLRYSSSLNGFVDESPFDEIALKRIRMALPLVRHPAADVQQEPIFRWVAEERFPLFADSDLFFQFLLCRTLARDPAVFAAESEGHVGPGLGSFEGMEQFAAYLDDGAGFVAMSFWIDATKCLARGPAQYVRGMRDLAERYFRLGAPLAVSEDVRALHRTEGGEIHVSLAPSLLQRARDLVLHKLHTYWVPRYLFHRAEAAAAQGLVSMCHRPYSAVGMASPFGMLPRQLHPPPPALLPHRGDDYVPRGFEPDVVRMSLMHLSASVEALVAPKSGPASTPPPPTSPTHALSMLSPSLARPFASIPKAASSPSLFFRSSSSVSSLRLSLAPSPLPPPLPSIFAHSHKYAAAPELDVLAVGLTCELTAGAPFLYHLRAKAAKVLCDPLLISIYMFWRDCEALCQVLPADQRLVQLQAGTIVVNYIKDGAPYDIGLSMAEREQAEALPPSPAMFVSLQQQMMNLLRDEWEDFVVTAHQSFRRACLEDAAFRHRQQHIVACSVPKNEIDEQMSSAEAQLLTACSELADELIEEQVLGQRLSILRELLHAMENGTDETLAGPKELADTLLQMMDGDHAQVWHFKKYLQKQGGLDDVLFWADVEMYRAIPSSAPRAAHARGRAIFQRYKATQRFNATSEEMIEPYFRPTTMAVEEAQALAEHRIASLWVPQFMEQSTFRSLRTQRLNRAEPEPIPVPSLYAGLPGFGSSDNEVMQFRNAMLAPSGLDRDRFLHYLTNHVVGASPLIGSDFKFWLEIQRYKDLCHTHCNKQLVLDKLDAISLCYLNSAVPPRVHVDIPEDMAASIMEKACLPGNFSPYIFRKAEQHLFVILIHYYPAYCIYRIESHANPWALPVNRVRAAQPQKKNSWAQLRSLAACPLPSSHELKFRAAPARSMQLAALSSMRRPHATSASVALAPATPSSLPSTVPATPLVPAGTTVFFARRPSGIGRRIPMRQTLHFSIESGLVYKREDAGPLPSHITVSRSDAAINQARDVRHRVRSDSVQQILSPPTTAGTISGRES